ncbi:MAG: YraN family protein [Steroidobacteraceae bacterium]
MDDRYRKATGNAGEDRALKHLRDHGLRLIARNYRCRSGEIDLVMLDGVTLALVEVRYRSRSYFGGAAASVTPRKQRRLLLAAEHLVGTHAELRRYAARFDVVALDGAKEAPTIQWIRNAFTSEGKDW